MEEYFPLLNIKQLSINSYSEYTYLDKLLAFNVYPCELKLHKRFTKNIRAKIYDALIFRSNDIPRLVQ